MRTRASLLLLQRRSAGGLRLPNVDCGKPVTQEALGEYLGISKQYVSHLETGARKPGRSVATALEDIGGPAVADWEQPADVQAEAAA